MKHRPDAGGTATGIAAASAGSPDCAPPGGSGRIDESGRRTAMHEGVLARPPVLSRSRSNPTGYGVESGRRDEDGLPARPRRPPGHPAVSVLPGRELARSRYPRHSRPAWSGVH